MMRRFEILEYLRLLWLARLSLAGRWSFALAFAPIVWPLLLAVLLLMSPEDAGYEPQSVATVLLGPAVAALGIGFGVRIVGAEIEQRTIELAYTVPGGAKKVWTAKLIAAGATLVLSTLLTGGFVAALLTEFPPNVLLDALLASLTYMCLALWLSVITRSEVTGALLSVPLLVLGILLGETRFSPFFNTLELVESGQYATREIVAWSTQNRVGQALACLALVLMAYGGADRREKLLG